MTSDGLVRFVLGVDGVVAPSDSSQGRGAWVCRDRIAECAELANRRNAWSRAFRRPVARQNLERFGK